MQEMDMGEEIINKVINRHLLIFDLDGTLIHTDEVNFLAYKDAIQKILNLDLALWHKNGKRFTREKLYSFIPNLHSQEYEKIIETKNSSYEKYLHKSKVNKFVLKIIEKFSQTNKIVLATNSHKNRAKMVLSYHNLTNYFDYFFYKECYEDIKTNKYEYVLNYLDIDPALVIVFENERSEISDAQSARIPISNIININNV